MEDAVHFRNLDTFVTQFHTKILVIFLDTLYLTEITASNCWHIPDVLLSSACSRKSEHVGYFGNSELPP